jgi:uncharacterized protein (DUF1330 family)
MPAYVIFYVDSIADPLLLERYKHAARPTLRETGGVVTVAYGRHEVLEGAPLAGVVMVEFPTFEAARAWYHSAGYQAAATLRQSAATAHAVLVEGLAPAHAGETR